MNEEAVLCKHGDNASDVCGFCKACSARCDLMRCDGVVSWDGALFYGDDPWASDVWHVLSSGTLRDAQGRSGSHV